MKKRGCRQKREVDDNIKEECYHSQKKLIEVYDNQKEARNNLKFITVVSKWVTVGKYY